MPLKALRWSAWKDSSLAALPLSTAAMVPGPVMLNFTRLSAAGQRLPSLSSIRMVDAARDRLFVTGKNWPKLFEIKLVKKGR